MSAVHSSLKNKSNMKIYHEQKWEETLPDILNIQKTKVEMSRDGTHLIVSTLNMYYKAGGSQRSGKDREGRAK